MFLLQSIVECTQAIPSIIINKFLFMGSKYIWQFFTA
jgi:hypothetical protein